jgi:hypothetical protein
MISICQAKGNSPTQNYAERSPTPTNPISNQDNNEQGNEDSKGHITFTA